MSPRERFYIAAHYYDLVTGELDKAEQTYKLWVQDFPRDYGGHVNFAYVYSILGENEKALAEGKDEFSVKLGNEAWLQKPRKYHARSLGMLRAKYAAAADKAALAPLLESAGCLEGLHT